MKLLAAACALAAAISLASRAQAQSCGATICPGEYMDIAYHAAAPGDVVTMGAGSYGSQTLTPDASKTSPVDVIFQPAPGAQVTIAGDLVSGSRTVLSGAKHFEVRDVAITGGVSLRAGVEDVTLRNIDASTFDLNGSKDIRILGGDWGPAIDGWNSIASTAPIAGFPSGVFTENVLIDGALFHDYLLSPNGVSTDVHMQCIQIWPGRNVTIRDSTFRNCTDFGILVDKGLAAGADPSNLTFEQNVFEEPLDGTTATLSCGSLCPRSGSSLRLVDRDGWSGARVAYNTLLGELVINNGVTAVVVKGNVGNKRDSFFCNAGSDTIYDHNVWSGALCSSTDRKVPLVDVLINPTAPPYDLHLQAGSAAIDAGDPLSYPATDIDGDARTGIPDAGADEFGTLPPPPSPPSPECADGIDNADPEDTLIDSADPGCIDLADNDETDPPPPPPPPPPSCVAPKLASGPQTDRTSTVTWTTIPDATGYRLYKDGVAIATAGPLATSAKFGSLRYGATPLGVAALCPDGEQLASAQTVETRVLEIP